MWHHSAVRWPLTLWHGGQDLISTNDSIGTMLIVNTDGQGSSFHTALPAAGPFRQ